MTGCAETCLWSGLRIARLAGAVRRRVGTAFVRNDGSVRRWQSIEYVCSPLRSALQSPSNIMRATAISPPPSAAHAAPPLPSLHLSAKASQYALPIPKIPSRHVVSPAYKIEHRESRHALKPIKLPPVSQPHTSLQTQTNTRSALAHASAAATARNAPHLRLTSLHFPSAIFAPLEPRRRL